MYVLFGLNQVHIHVDLWVSGRGCLSFWKVNRWGVVILTRSLGELLENKACTYMLDIKTALVSLSQ